jgi:hypothetical protein
MVTSLPCGSRPHVGLFQPMRRGLARGDTHVHACSETSDHDAPIRLSTMGEIRTKSAPSILIDVISPARRDASASSDDDVRWRLFVTK